MDFACALFQSKYVMLILKEVQWKEKGVTQLLYVYILHNNIPKEVVGRNKIFHCICHRKNPKQYTHVNVQFSM